MSKTAQDWVDQINLCGCSKCYGTVLEIMREARAEALEEAAKEHAAELERLRGQVRDLKDAWGGKLPGTEKILEHSKDRIKQLLHHEDVSIRISDALLLVASCPSCGAAGEECAEHAKMRDDIMKEMHECIRAARKARE